MNAQPATSEINGICVSTMPGSDDSDEETSQEEQPITSWNDLSIIERVGLNSLEMSEKDVEAAFCQITLAFRSDQYTLKQRLQAEEHARNLAEENVQLELTRGRETLEMLKALCLDSRRSTVLQKLELSLDILGGTVERISNTAEVLGAVHQEARVSRAVELMVAHVENLRRRYKKNLSELEEARQQIQLRASQRDSLNRESPESEETRNIRRLTKQGSLRRRISTSIIPSQTNEKKKKESKKRSSKKASSSCHSPCHSSESSFCVLNDSCFTDDRTLDPTETVENHSESNTLSPPILALEPSSDPKQENPATKPESAANASSKKSTSETLHQRHRGRAAQSRKRSDRKSPHHNQRTHADRCGSQCKGPGTHWMHRCRWALLCLYLSVFVCFVTMIYYLLIQSDSDR